jgi:hypothetical protein
LKENEMDKTEAAYLKLFGFGILLLVMLSIFGIDSCIRDQVQERQACIEACGPGHVAQLPNGQDRCVCGAVP